MEWIAKCVDPSLLKEGMKNAKARQRMDVYWQAFRRLCEIEGLNYDDPLEREFHSTLTAYEELLSEKNGRATRASRTRQKLQRRGVIQCLEDWAVANTPTDGFKLLIDAGLVELTGEHLVLKYPEHFSGEALEQALHRLVGTGWLEIAPLRPYPKAPERHAGGDEAMHGPEEIQPSRSANWLAEIMSRARDSNACMQPNCTTCGAIPFRRALWASAEAVSPGRAAKAIADQLQKLEPPLDDEGIQFILWELNRTIGQNEMSELAEGFNTSHSGDVYRRMLAHEESIAAKRKEHELRNDPVEVERRRAEKKAKKAQQHSIRLAAKAEQTQANAIGPPNLSFEISFPTLDLFLDHWASRYRDENDEKFYDPYIGKADLKTDEAALTDLFRWKNGVRLSAAKLVSIRANYFDDWTEDANLERRYLDPSEDGDRPIWNIFYLHCRFPDQYPIYDQHAHRAMIYIQEHAIREDLSKKPELVYKSYKQYRCFVAHIRRATGHKLRTIDRGLYTFGQFLKLAKPFWNPAEHQS